MSTLKELVERVKGSSKQFADLPDGKAIALLREVFRQIGDEVARTNDGVVKVSGLGSFRIKQVEREKDGKKEMVKKITFRAATVKEKEARPAKGKAG